MTLSHAVVLIDHHDAQLVQFHAEEVEIRKVKAHSHHTRQHGSAVRTEHEFFSEVCDAMEPIAEILVAGSQTARADFRHYVEKHRPALAKQITGWESADNPTDGELLASARKHFLKYDQLGKAPAAG